MASTSIAKKTRTEAGRKRNIVTSEKTNLRSIAGIGASGGSDVASEKDQYLAEAYAPERSE